MSANYSFKYLLYTAFLTLGVLQSQSQTISGNYKNLDSVNISTGQYQPQSLKKSVYQVRVVDQERSTQPATGSRTDRFYIIKDADGNYYKLKFLAMGVNNDGGTRGKPVIQYELISK
ncbi:MAG: hypothetical protein DI598_03250 [Pseudopedobacter saltans]|uniref:Uncharacterized protein n=1 Tax=Pseudopedobacter saltans TaxID=151895 RepID=A0A2W5F7N1_9SPHI|nr:MAG: hypothetical protein DI598_03250 [Pseudopedobacter saltans]